MNWYDYMIIQGEVLTFDKENKNKDTIPISEEENVIETLKNSKIRVCNRDAPHKCDFSPFAEIGYVATAYQTNGVVKAIGIITDAIAQQKLDNGTWKKAWSIGATAKNNNGIRTGVNIHSLTLVENPAYENATFKILNADAKDTSSFNLLGTFEILQAQNLNTIDINKNYGDKNMSEPQITELNQTIEQLRADNAKLAASLKDYEDVKKQLLNANDKLAASIPSSQIKELVQAGITAYKEHEQKAALLEKLEAATGKKGEYNSLSASALTDILTAIEKNPITVNSNTSPFPNGVPEYRKPRGNK